jgi:hypothetical protein
VQEFFVLEKKRGKPMLKWLPGESILETEQLLDPINEFEDYLKDFRLADSDFQQVLRAVRAIAENVVVLNAFGNVTNPNSAMAVDVLRMTDNRTDEAIVLLMEIYSNLQLCKRHNLLTTRS